MEKTFIKSEFSSTKEQESVSYKAYKYLSKNIH